MDAPSSRLGSCPSWTRGWSGLSVCSAENRPRVRTGSLHAALGPGQWPRAEPESVSTGPRWATPHCHTRCCLSLLLSHAIVFLEGGDMPAHHLHTVWPGLLELEQPCRDACWTVTPAVPEPRPSLVLTCPRRSLPGSRAALPQTGATATHAVCLSRLEHSDPQRTDAEQRRHHRGPTGHASPRQPVVTHSNVRALRRLCWRERCRHPQINRKVTNVLIRPRTGKSRMAPGATRHGRTPTRQGSPTMWPHPPEITTGATQD